MAASPSVRVVNQPIRVDYVRCGCGYMTHPNDFKENGGKCGGCHRKKKVEEEKIKKQ